MKHAICIMCEWDLVQAKWPPGANFRTITWYMEPADYTAESGMVAGVNI